MPCYNGNEREQLGMTVSKYKNEAKKWEAGFCALVNHLDKKLELDLHTILVNAGLDAKLDLISLYETHIEEDITRLKKDLTRYSDQELYMIKKILDK